MMTLHQLYERAYSEGIEIDEWHMRGLRASAYPEGWIAIDPRKYRDKIEFKCDLAHEIGHCETGAFYNIYSPYDLKSKCEYKANKRAVEILMPFDEVVEAMHHGYKTAWALAGLFEVTQEFAEMALKIYEGKLVENSEREQIKALLAGFGLKEQKAGKGKLPPLVRARDLIGR